MLSDTVADARSRALVGEAGAFDVAYQGYITGVLDAHAAVGARCIVDLHNYCRYKDFRFQADGSVIGLARPADPLQRAYTTDRSQVWTRIFATAPGASLKPAAFADFWRRAAQVWKDHPGFGGYGLMNEPHDLPRPGETVESTSGEDLMIWPAFARAAIDAIRAVDPTGTIYLLGNLWGGAMNIGPQVNPAWPLPGTNIVYEVHAYLDAWNNGRGYDWELESRKDYVVGFGPGRINLDTGAGRMKIATEWARQQGQRVALTATAMPLDDPRWEESFRRLVAHCRENGWEVHSWMGGSHWVARNGAIHHVPGWHQDRTLEAPVAGPMKAAAALDVASVFDDAPGWAAAGAAITVTVYARGHVAKPRTITVASDGGGTFSKTRLVIPAGANGQDSYTFTLAANRVTTLRYEGDGQVPPPRSVYSLDDPVRHAEVNLEQAAMALLARHGASHWDMADGFTDYVQGRPAGEGEAVRAVADSGFGSSLGNAMEMVNSLNQDGANMGPWRPAVMHTGNARKHTDHSAPGSTGLWCRKTAPWSAQPNPRNRVPYRLNEPHFAIAAVRAGSAAGNGPVFQASAAWQAVFAELALQGGRPVARWRDASGITTELSAPVALAPGQAAVLSLLSAPGRQSLRVGSQAVASGSASLGAAAFDQLLIGWGFIDQRPVSGFGGQVFAVATGRGHPSAAEMAVLERFLGRA